jgi:tetratricopeptide (TPR) repeat protein
LATDHEQELREGYGVTTQNVKKLPSWQAVMEKILRLPKTDQVKALKSLYSRFNFYKEYVAVVEASGEISKDFQTMNTLRDAYERIGRLDQSIFLGKEILKKSDEKGFPSQGSQEYRRILADISEYLARSGDFQSSLEYAQKATLIYPEVYYFAQELAKLALKENKRAILIKAFEELAKANPKEWGPWQVMAIIYKEWEDSANQTRCEQKATELK